MTPEIAPYHAAILAVCDEFDALVLDLASVHTSASRLSDAATTAAAAMPSDADCGPRIIAEFNELAAGMLAIKNQFAVMQDGVGAQAADFARKVRDFELALRKEQN
jgi:hypothetical protein